MVRHLVFFAISIAAVIGCGGKTALDGTSSGGVGSSGATSGGSGSGAASSAVTCGTATCSLGTEDCCIESSDGRSSSCAPKGQCMGVALACTSAANCPSVQVCCGFDGQSSGAECRASCGTSGPSDGSSGMSGSGGASGTSGGRDPGDGPGGSSGVPDPGGDDPGPGQSGPRGGIQLCATDAECPQGERCTPTSLGFGLCVGGVGRRPPPPPPPPPTPPTPRAD